MAALHEGGGGSDGGSDFDGDDDVAPKPKVPINIFPFLETRPLNSGWVESRPTGPSFFTIVHDIVCILIVSASPTSTEDLQTYRPAHN